MWWQLGMLGANSASAFRHRETKKNLCIGGRLQDILNIVFWLAVRQMGNKEPIIIDTIIIPITDDHDIVC